MLIEIPNQHSIIPNSHNQSIIMSWLFKALQSDDPDSPSPPLHESPTKRNAGAVIDDLSVIGETIGRHLRGFAAFLAPPPITSTERQQQPPPQSHSSSSQTLQGIRNDLVEIGGSFKSGLSRLSGNKAVTGFSKFASSLLQFQNRDDEEEDDGVPGITEEVVKFVKEISEMAECWTDFPVTLRDDFEMSDAQREHISTIEQLVPSIRDLRLDLRHYLVDNQFWMIYFILLLPRLNEHDFELLSTPEIIETRNITMQRLQKKRRTAKLENSITSDASHMGSKVFEKGKNIPSREKEVTEIVNATRALEIDDEDNTERWLEDANTDTGISVNNKKEIEHEEDVSFSDLEDDHFEDDDNDLPSRLSAGRRERDIKATSPCESNDWVRLSESSVNRGDLDKPRQSISGESSDWLAVDEFD